MSGKESISVFGVLVNELQIKNSTELTGSGLGFLKPEDAAEGKENDRDRLADALQVGRIGGGVFGTGRFALRIFRVRQACNLHAAGQCFKLNHLGVDEFDAVRQFSRLSFAEDRQRIFSDESVLLFEVVGKARETEFISFFEAHTDDGLGGSIRYRYSSNDWVAEMVPGPSDTYDLTFLYSPGIGFFRKKAHVVGHTPLGCSRHVKDILVTARI